jgi:general secretion pathway protein B
VSVIWEALRKAEGERELAHVPTPTTIHGEAAERKRRALPWIAACALLTSAAGMLLVWVGPLAKMGPPSTDLEPRAILSPVADGANTPLEQPPQREIENGSSPPKEKVPGAAAAKSREIADVTLPRSLRARAPVPIRAAGIPDPQHTEAGEAGPRVQGSVRERNARPHVAAPEPATAALTAPDRAVPAPVVPPVTGNAEGRADPTAPSAQSAAITRTDTATSQVQEALAKMTLNVLVYSEDAAERWVFIGGHRYVEGERVDGRFLVQEIRPEGVLLSRQGEQALLRLPGRSR